MIKHILEWNCIIIIIIIYTSRHEVGGPAAINLQAKIKQVWKLNKYFGLFIK